MKWKVNATEGIVVFGKSSSSGNGTDELNLPAAIIRDKNGSIYIVDERNHRVVSVTENDPNSIIIAGGTDQLSGPIYLAFNREGDLYVSDSDSFRVQMFAKENDTSSGYAHTRASQWTLILCFLSLIVAVVSSF
jgi:DNA-binding beta-propeller fold protein YncE